MWSIKPCNVITMFKCVITRFRMSGSPWLCDTSSHTKNNERIEVLNLQNRKLKKNDSEKEDEYH